MNFSDVDSTVIDAHLPDFAPVAFIGAGGQKRVFRCEYEGQPWALPLILVSDKAEIVDEGDDEAGSTQPVLDSVSARARREVQIMGECRSPHVVRLGPVLIQTLQIENLAILYFLEELIEGEDLKAIFRAGPLSTAELIRLGIHMAKAIDALWHCSEEHQIIHRDIKPGNIMRRTSGDFVLLDIGLAFDLLDESLSAPGAIPGTALYLTPDQLDHTKKRQMDYRSDMFALGTVIYEAATGQHPFHRQGMSSMELFKTIVRSVPESIANLRKDMPDALAKVIMRLLAKKPHLRYRTCQDLVEALEAIDPGGTN